ncbi:MAG TPA: hypothetical protein DEB15_04670 [Pusillimonas sp.]|jgi:gluconate 2-dehydrogenase gamma chain|nr:hypothetical protein [Pusillimonas sp.]|tara:strand:+ start:5768 stop:6559 length:792 start_codon:yes stop_codon:yes gene_type:complete
MGNSRREFLKVAGLTAVATGAEVASSTVHAQQPSEHQHASAAGDAQPIYTFFNADEIPFIETATARLIPADEAGPGALEADVPFFIDKQLGGAWGAGERLYRSGPWQQGEPTQGYQLPFTPAELFRTALRGIQTHVKEHHDAAFDALSPEKQDAYLTLLQDGDIDLEGVPSNVFFESLWGMTLEGFFSDPIYGGNKDMISWKMIGFPGAHANFYDLVDKHGIAFQREPISIGSNASGVIHIHPDIPASTGNAVYHGHHRHEEQ